jgi:response regulator of citrate/malate metabolism
MIRVLVVDDDFRVADLHARFVGRLAGFQVVGVAHTAGDAVDLAKRLEPDLALLDQYLPDAQGTSIAAQLGCDVIMLTAAADSGVVREALGRGAVNYLVKPFSEADLAERLRAYARFHTQFGSDRPLEQADIDRAARMLHEGDRVDAALRKGRSSQTAQLVIEAVRAAGESVTAADLADQLGLSRATAQRYLSDLAADGRVRVALRYGTTGRPEHLYSWSTSNPRRSPGPP